MNSVFGYKYKPAAHLQVTDEDAADFLQSQFSNELRPFASGRCTYGLWLDVKGKVLADSYVLCDGPEQFRILSEFSSSELIAEKLQRHIIADDVEIEALPTGAAICLIGAGAAEVLCATGIELPVKGQFSRGPDVSVFAGRRSKLPNFELLFESDAAAEALKEKLLQHSVEFVSAGWIQRERIAAGIASVPTEIGPGDLPGEGGLIGDAVSITKGCYLGQEVVARMHNVGHPQRGLFRLSGSGSPPICPTAIYNSESKKIGELRSAFANGDTWSGIALLKTRLAEVGETVNCGDNHVQIIDRFSMTTEASK
jgi:tRNA-modifying protein YgfZ